MRQTHQQRNLLLWVEWQGAQGGKISRFAAAVGQHMPRLAASQQRSKLFCDVIIWRI